MKFTLQERKSPIDDQERAFQNAPDYMSSPEHFFCFTAH